LVERREHPFVRLVVHEDRARAPALRHDDGLLRLAHLVDVLLRLRLEIADRYDFVHISEYISKLMSPQGPGTNKGADPKVGAFVAGGRSTRPCRRPCPSGRS